MKENRIDIETHLSRLSDMTDYEVADRDPDVRGWKVYSAEGIKFGKVEELIVDPEQMKVRYLDIEVDEGVEGVTDERHMLIPVGVASIDGKDDKVFIRTVQTVSLLKSPPYKGGAITREYEDELRQTYFQDKENREDKGYYDSDYYNEDNFYEARRKHSSDSLQVIAASALIGERITGINGRNAGRIEEIMVDVNIGKIAYAVLSFGNGTLGLADKYFAVPWEVIKPDTSSERYYLSVPEERLQNAPEFNKDNLHSTMDRDYLINIYNYYGVKPYR